MNKSLKILIITNFYFPHIGGIEQNIHQLITHKSKTVNIDLMVPLKQNRNALDQIDGARVLKLKSLQFITYDYTPYNTLMLTNFSIFPHFAILLKASIYKLLKKSFPKLLLVPHGGSTISKDQLTPSQYYVKSIYNFILGFPLSRYAVDVIISVSDWEKRNIRKYISNVPAITIRNGIDIYGPSSIRKQKYFIFVGRIEPVKNIEYTIGIFNELQKIKQYADHKLYIVGNPNSNNQYKFLLDNLINNLGIVHKVEFLGEVTGKKKLDLIAQAKILFCLSLIESDSIALKEALSVKTKVVMSNRGGMVDYDNNPNCYMVDVDVNNYILTDISKFINSKYDSSYDNSFMTWAGMTEAYEKLY